MPDEFAAWFEFYKLYPFDDYHRYFRPAALVAHSMAGADLGELTEWLERPLSVPADSKYSAADLATMKAFGMKPPGKT